ncbi:MAG: hypothetical protein JJU00_18945 [Opitutales bacterium]|nr:hypothetical protein [Opitutales bacterium]
MSPIHHVRHRALPLLCWGTAFSFFAPATVLWASDPGEGEVVGWGSNVNGAEVPPVLEGVLAIATGHRHSLALLSDGSVVGWGDNGFGQATPPDGLTGATAITAGSGHSLALLADGTVVGWGENQYGQAVPPDNLTDAIAIAAGAFHSLALRADGTVVGWGRDAEGQTIPPSGLSDVTAIAAGGNQSLALKSDGTVRGWGGDYLLWNFPPPNLENVVAIAAGSHHCLALLADLTLVEWGLYPLGRDQPHLALSHVVGIAAGGARSVALLANGTVVQWEIWSQSDPFPEPPAGLNDAIAIAAGPSQSLALRGEVVPPLRAIPAVQRVHLVPSGDHSVEVVLDGLQSWGEVASYDWAWIEPDGTPGSASGPHLAVEFPIGRTSVTFSVTGTDGQREEKTFELWVIRFGESADPGEVVFWGPDGFAGPPVPITDAISVAAGRSQGFVAVREDGSVVGWGGGIGETAPGLSDVRQVVAGDSHALALRADGTVVGWGANNLGQASPPSGLSGVTAIAAGRAHSVALRADGTTVRWGEWSATRKPSFIPPLPPTIAIAAGGSGNLSLKVDSWVLSWGNQRADGSGLSYVSISPSTDVIAVAEGSSFSACLQGDGTVLAWGYLDPEIPATAFHPEAAQLFAGPHVLVALDRNGDLHRYGRFENRPPDLTRVRTMALGKSRGIAIVGASQSTFGISVEGAEGGSASVAPEGSEYLPEEIVRLSEEASAGYVFDGWTGALEDTRSPIWASVSPGFSATARFVEITSRSVVGWGDNRSGARVPPPDLDGVEAIAAGETHSLALLDDGSVVAWGTNQYGESTPPAGLEDVTAIAAGSRFSLALRADGTVADWGRFTEWTPPPPPYTGGFIGSFSIGDEPAEDETSENPTIADLTDVVAIAAGTTHRLALLADGTVRAWGGNGSGQASPPSSLADVIAIAAGAAHSLALRADGSVVGWGSNSSGQRNPPSGLTGAVAIAAGSYHSLALLADGTVIGWGFNHNGQATPPPGLANVVAIAAGTHSLAHLADGSVISWGDDRFGQASSPGGLTDVIAIAAGTNHSLALRSRSSPPPPTLLDAYLAAHLAGMPEASRDWHADANQNGLSNLIEYARGSDPAAAGTSSVWPVLVPCEESGGLQVFLTLRIDDPALEIIAEASADLDSWTWILRQDASTGEWESNPAFVDLIEWQPPSNGLQEARLRAAPTAGEIFMRMRVEYRP